ncbi:MAG: hypothetical protein HY688_02480 [Chloroflexi bacterium]|nr:hypothetical protein [Chloroflexota bacterium]
MDRYQWGTLLIMLGVLVWLPFVVLLVRGDDPPFFLFLPLHLAGVLTGAYLRRGRRGHVPRVRRVGNILIIVGVAAWVPYFGLKALGNDPEALFFLPFHLAGVIPGVLLRYYHALRRAWAGLTSRRAARFGPP